MLVVINCKLPWNHTCSLTGESPSKLYLTFYSDTAPHHRGSNAGEALTGLDGDDDLDGLGVNDRIIGGDCKDFIQRGLLR